MPFLSFQTFPIKYFRFSTCFENLFVIGYGKISDIEFSEKTCENTKKKYSIFEIFFWRSLEKGSDLIVEFD